VTAIPTIANTAALLASNVWELIKKHVKEQPQRTAIGTSDMRTVLTYAELDALVWSIAAQLSSFGLKRGSTVALVSDNSIEFVVGLLAVLSAGGRVAPLNPALSSTELYQRLSQLSTDAVLVPRCLANKLEFTEGAPLWIMDFNSSGTSGTVQVLTTKGRATACAASVEPNVWDEDAGNTALLMFTGGTTGVPKLVSLTHRNLVASIENISSGYALSPEDATLIVMPLFHGHGLIAGLLSTLASGGSAYVPSTGTFSAHLFWPDVIRLGVTWYTAVPTIHRILLNRASKEYPKSAPVPLRFIRSCSAPLDEELAAAVAVTFGAPMISAYGMTETSHQLSSNPLPINGLNKMSSVGLATGVDIRIVGESGRDVPLGNLGEIWVRGATVTPGYLSNPEANSESFVNGWFRSGDLGSKDEDGYIFVKGRLKEMINRGGEKISPRDIDAVLLSHPKVLEAASFGEADAMYGETVQAAVVLRPRTSSTENELRDYCRARLSAFEVPQRIYIVAEFPRTAKGSTDRRALAQQFAGVTAPA
jgi:acyl-CoA synthetase (AMP-forming)/AMP-acid ligase II